MDTSGGGRGTSREADLGARRRAAAALARRHRRRVRRSKRRHLSTGHPAQAMASIRPQPHQHAWRLQQQCAPAKSLEGRNCAMCAHPAAVSAAASVGVGGRNVLRSAASCGPTAASIASSASTAAILTARPSTSSAVTSLGRRPSPADCIVTCQGKCVCTLHPEVTQYLVVNGRQAVCAQTVCGQSMLTGDINRPMCQPHRSRRACCRRGSAGWGSSRRRRRRPARPRRTAWPP